MNSRPYQSVQFITTYYYTNTHCWKPIGSCYHKKLVTGLKTYQSLDFDHLACFFFYLPFQSAGVVNELLQTGTGGLRRYLGPLSLMPAWISNNMLNQVWNEITYPFRNLHRWSLGMRAQPMKEGATEYWVPPSLIGRAHTQNDPCGGHAYRVKTRIIQNLDISFTIKKTLSLLNKKPNVFRRHFIHIFLFPARKSSYFDYFFFESFFSRIQFIIISIHKKFNELIMIFIVILANTQHTVACSECRRFRQNPGRLILRDIFRYGISAFGNSVLSCSELK